MRVVAALAGVLLIAVILVDAFETIVQPRRVTRRARLAPLVMLWSWAAWSAAAHHLGGHAPHDGATRRDRRLGVFGPLALLLLLAIWAAALLLGFALVQWGLGSALTGIGHPGFGSDLYFSGTTFFTLGLGDVVPRSGLARVATVAEVGTGFSFLALIIGYLPSIYGTFSAREVEITLLDARAGSPPSAAGLLLRLGQGDDGSGLDAFLRDWERWAAEVLESHLSYPVLSFFRSQHEHQSWLAALTMILDACSLLIVGIETPSGRLCKRQATLTFAIARHAVGDISQVLNTPPRASVPDRLPPADLARVRAALAAAGVPLCPGEDADRQLAALRALYEPYVAALGAYLRFPLPSWLPTAAAVDAWATTAWQHDPAAALSALRDGVLAPRDGEFS